MWKVENNKSRVVKRNILLTTLIKSTETRRVSVRETPEPIIVLFIRSLRKNTVEKVTIVGASPVPVVLIRGIV